MNQNQANMAERVPAYKRIFHNLTHMSRDQRMEFLLYFGVSFGLWFVGHMHFSFAWIIMILMIFVGWQYQMEEKSKRREKMEKALQTTFMEKIKNLPSWVYFSDTEKAEWLNEIMSHMWPYVSEMVEKIMKETVEPAMQKNMPSALSTLYFDKITLGNDAPRIGEVKAYQSGDVNKKDEFIFDLDLSYNGDAQVKLSVKNVKLGINNIELKGVLRVIFKPLVSEYNPVGGVTVFFLNRPKLKFDLTNLLNVLDIPGLKSTLRRITDDVLASFVVLPNRVAIPLAQGVDPSDLQYPIPEGVLRVRIIEAKDLEAKDIGVLKKGKSDPYAMVVIGAQTFRTKIVNNNLNPEWNETFEAFVDNHEGQELEVRVYDEDTSSKDSKIGSVEMDIAGVVNQQGHCDAWLPLKGVKHGRVHLELKWFPLEKSAEFLSPSPTDPGKAVAALIVKPILAETLPSTSGKAGTMRSVYVEATVGETTLQTFQCYAEKSEWKQALRFFVVEPQSEEAKIKVIEAKGTKTLGSLTFNVRSLLNKPELALEQAFPLENSGDKSTLTCRFTLRILKAPLSQANAGPRPNAQEQAPRPTEETDAIPVQTAGGLNASEAPPRPPVPSVVVTREGSHEDHGGTLDDRASDSGSTYEGSIYGNGHAHSLEDLTCRGHVHLHLKYFLRRNLLEVTVKSVRDLVSRHDSKDKTNPFVRLYLLPDRTKRTRRCTQILKGVLSGEFNEVFDYPIGLDQLRSRPLEVAVKSDRGFLIGRVRNRLLGTSTLDLSKYDLTEGCDVTCDLFKLRPSD